MKLKEKDIKCLINIPINKRSKYVEFINDIIKAYANFYGCMPKKMIENDVLIYNNSIQFDLPEVYDIDGTNDSVIVDSIFNLRTRIIKKG